MTAPCIGCDALAAEIERHHQLIACIGAEPESGADPFRAERRASRTRVRLASDADELAHGRTTLVRIHNAWQADVRAGRLDPREDAVHA